MEALAVALAGLGSAAAVLVLALKGWSAERRAGEQSARAERAEANATSYSTQLSDMTNRHREEKERADAIEDAWVAAVADEPVAGAGDRLLAKLAAAARAARRDGARVVPAPEPAAEPRGGDLELLRPGE